MKNGLKWLDSDMHMAEPWDLWHGYIEPEFEDKVFAWAGAAKGYSGLVSGPTPNIREVRRQRLHEYGPYVAGDGTWVDPAGQLRAMDREGIDAAVLYPTLALSVRSAPDVGAASALRRAFNGWLHDFCAYEPSRLKMNGMIHAGDIDVAVAEIRRVKEFGAVSISLDPRPNREPFDDPVYEPIWTAAEECQLTIGFHNGLPGQMEERYGARPTHLYTHASSRPVGHMCTFMELLFGGVLERHPRLHCVFLEAGASWVGYWLFRLEEEWEKFGQFQEEAYDNVTMPPLEYWKRQCWASVECDEWSLPGVIATVGDDNLVVSSDFPHFDSAFPEARERFMSIAGVSVASKRKILWTNCARLYHLD